MLGKAKKFKIKILKNKKILSKENQKYFQKKKIIQIKYL